MSEPHYSEQEATAGSLEAERSRFSGVALLLGTSMIWGLPLLFLFYAVLGSAALGLAILAVLILIQWLAFRPFWKRLHRG